MSTTSVNSGFKEFVVHSSHVAYKQTKKAANKTASVIIDTTKHVGDSALRGAKLLATDATSQRTVLKALATASTAAGRIGFKPGAAISASCRLMDNALKVLSSGMIIHSIKNYDWKKSPILPVIDFGFDALSFVTGPIDLLMKLKIISLGRFATPFTFFTLVIDLGEQTYMLGKHFYKITAFVSGDGYDDIKKIIGKEKEYAVKVEKAQAELSELLEVQAELKTSETSSEEEKNRLEQEIKDKEEEIKGFQEKKSRWHSRKTQFIVKGVSTCLKVAFCVSLIALFVVLGVSAIGATSIVPGVNIATTLLAVGAVVGAIGITLLILKMCTPDAKERKNKEKANFAW